MGLSTEGHGHGYGQGQQMSITTTTTTTTAAAADDVVESTLPQNRPNNRLSVYDTPMQSASTMGNGDPGREMTSRHRPQGSQDMKDVPTNGQERNGRSASGDDTQGVAVGDRSRPPASRRPSERSRICGKCGGHLTGQFVRALGDTYHLECFTCHDCGKIVASKFFPVPDQPPNQYPLCETDYFRRLDLLCHACGGALRGSYITALDRKYHIEHFTCSVCPTVFGAQDSYYEHEGNVYCHYHYSTKFAQRCNGCRTAILKQFVEIFRNGQNQHWHPECYMIHKYWNVRLYQGEAATIEEQALSEDNATEEMRKVVRESEEHVEEKVLWIWRTLSSFEEKSATCISDMLLHVSNGAYMDGVVAAKKFIMHVDLLFSAADGLDQTLYTRTSKGLSYSREAKLLCKKVVAFFQLLAESQETGVRRLGVTQELLSLVTGLAHYLKLLIRICLQGALKLERETKSQEGLTQFLEDIGTLDEKLEVEGNARDSRLEAEGYVARSADNCGVCGKSVEDKCYSLKEKRFHAPCLVCAKCGRQVGSENLSETRWDEASQKIICERHATPAALGGFAQVTRLQQYVHLLRVAHARLLATLRTSGALPHTSDDPNLTDYDSNQGHRVSTQGSADPPLLRSNTRSQSYGGSSRRAQSPTYEQTLGDIRRLRSTRMDKQVSTTNRRARTSRIIDGPEGMRPGSDEKKERRMTGNFQIVEDRDVNGEPSSQLNFGNHEGMTLDDIPRIVQAQQTREQRPNASKFARGQMVPQEPKARLVTNGHNRHLSEDQEQFHRPEGVVRQKKYFSELSALEYFIVRHVAVLSMEPLLEGIFNQEELLDLIETKRPTFWGKFGKAFQKTDGRKQKGKQRGIFGVALEQLVERDYAESTDGVGPGALRIPVLIQDAISAMRTMDMSVEGVFRKNGNIKRLNDVKEEIDRKEVVDVDLTKENPVQVAALLKKFLRDLPDPLLTFKLHKLWIATQNITDEDRRRRVLHLTCCLLPKAHRDTMEVLFAFLQWVSSFSHVDEESGSKMDIHNLATVMAPNILHLGPRDVPLDDNLLAIETVHSLIEFNEYMCEVPEDLSLILNDSSLFSASADITTKEILKRYGDRATGTTGATAVLKPSPNISNNNTTPPGLKASATDPVDSPGFGSSSTPPPKSRDGRSGAPVVTRVDTDPEQASAWQNESSVRHVGGGVGPNDMAPPTQPYALGHGANLSTESQKEAQRKDRSPQRNSWQGRRDRERDQKRESGYEQKSRAMGVT